MRRRGAATLLLFVVGAATPVVVPREVDAGPPVALSPKFGLNEYNSHGVPEVEGVMRSRTPSVVLVFLVAALAACATGATPGELKPAGQALSAEVLSPASVRLAWQPVADASGYALAVRYGDEAFLPAADLPAEALTFTHFVVPGAPQVVYRLNAATAHGELEVGTVTLDLPELKPNPLSVEPEVSAPTIDALPAMPEMPVLPTIDPSNPDPFAMATAMAELTNSMVDLGAQAMAEAQPIDFGKEIGREGGEVTMTDPSGVVYTLSIPTDALSETTTITLTPIGSLNGSPFAGELVAGVQIKPPISFAGPAKLTIALPQGASATRAPLITGFIVSGLSGEFSLTPFVNEGQNTYGMSAYWGDTFGLAAATPDEVAAQAARIPSDWRAQMAQQLAALRAADPDRSLEGDARVAAQVLQALVSQVASLTARPSSRGGPGLAALASGAARGPDLQGGNAATLLGSILWSEAIWDFLNQMFPPGATPPPGSDLARSMADWKTRIVAELTAAIKAYMDEHDGCRTGLALHAEALRQILRSPRSAFQQALAAQYRERYGPPPDLQCEFRFQIVRSSIKEFREGDDYLGNDTETYAVHSEPWNLELAIRDGRMFLQGPVGTQYDVWEITHSKCPPTMQLRPFPTSVVWITNLALVFDEDDRVSDFRLQGVTPDGHGTNIDSQITTDQPQPGQCKVLSETAGTNPVDEWGFSFSALHTGPRGLDDWMITGEDSYVATDTIAGRVEGRYTEDTTIILTVTEK